MGHGFSLVAEHACGRYGKGFAWPFQSVASGRRVFSCMFSTLVVMALGFVRRLGCPHAYGMVVLPPALLAEPPTSAPSNMTGAAMYVQ